jgi:hypothetical protein
VDSLLDQVPAAGMAVRGRDVVDLLRPVYRIAGERAAPAPPPGER